MWINQNEMQLLEKVMNDEKNIPLNRKRTYKLRHLSFYMSNGKSIKNVCNNLEKLAYHNTNLHHQYKEVMRKYGLTTNDDKLTKYGNMLLSLIHYDNNRIYKEMKSVSSIDDLSADIPFTIEFFLFCVVYKLINNSEEREKENVNIKQLATDVIDDANYFFCNVKDTLLETTNRASNFNNLFNYENKNFYKTVQGINYSGYEIKKLLRLPPNEINSFIELYTRLLNEIESVDESDLTQAEKPYYQQIFYYNSQVQPDVVNRLRHSILNYIIIKSIVRKRNKISLCIPEEYSNIYDSNFITTSFENNSLKDIYNLVFFEKDSKYLKKEYKILHIERVSSDLEYTLSEDEYQNENICLTDKVILYNKALEKIETEYIYKVVDIAQDGNNYVYKLEKNNVINQKKIGLLENQIGGLTHANN